MSAKKICVDLGRRSYDIVVCCNEIKRLGALIKRSGLGTDAVIITNPAIRRLYGNRVKASLASAGFNTRFEIVPDGEKAKSEKHCMRLLNNISKFDNSRRRIFIIALGGGVIGDLSGFIASIYRRGVPYVQVPTTLLSQVDSAIGGKVAIDLAVGKNLAGSFYQPRLVFSDVAMLKSLPRKELISGLAEVVKYGVIRSPGLFRYLERNSKKIFKCNKNALQYIVHTCSSIKAGVVEKDEYDNKNIRVMLNLGHTIGHAIETAAQYKRSYSHGQAIALGMLCASFIAKELDLLQSADHARIKTLIKKLGLPVKLTALKLNDIYKAQEHDKKFIHGKNRFVLPVKIGKVVVKEAIPAALVKDSIMSIYK